MLLLPDLAVRLQGRVGVCLQLSNQASLQRRKFLGGPTRNRSHSDISRLAPLLQVPFDGGSRDSQELDNLASWEALIDGSQDLLSHIDGIGFHWLSSPYCLLAPAFPPFILAPGSTFWLPAVGGLLALGEGETALAYSRVEQAVALFKEMRQQHGTTVSLYALAQVVEASGDDARSQSLYEEGIAVARKEGNRQTVAFGLEGLARVVAVQGEVSWAARLWGAAETLRETIGAPIPPVERPAYESSVTAARAQLGEKPFAAAWAEGRLMTPESAWPGGEG